MPWLGGFADLKMPIHTHILADFLWFPPVKSVTLTWFLACDQVSLVGLCLKVYKSLSSGYDLCHYDSPKIGFLHFDPYDLVKYVKP